MKNEFIALVVVGMLLTQIIHGYASDVRDQRILDNIIQRCGR